MAKILEMKDTNKEDEMIPVDQWDGECWKTFFDQFCKPYAEEHKCSEWDVLANFISVLLRDDGNTESGSATSEERTDP